jgi:hypothetical protein
VAPVISAIKEYNKLRPYQRGCPIYNVGWQDETVDTNRARGLWRGYRGVLVRIENAGCGECEESEDWHLELQTNSADGTTCTRGSVRLKVRPGRMDVSEIRNRGTESVRESVMAWTSDVVAQRGGVTEPCRNPEGRGQDAVQLRRARGRSRPARGGQAPFASLRVNRFVWHFVWARRTLRVTAHHDYFGPGRRVGGRGWRQLARLLRPDVRELACTD